MTVYTLCEVRYAPGYSRIALSAAGYSGNTPPRLRGQSDRPQTGATPRGSVQQRRRRALSGLALHVPPMAPGAKPEPDRRSLDGHHGGILSVGWLVRMGNASGAFIRAWTRTSRHHTATNYVRVFSPATQCRIQAPARRVSRARSRCRDSAIQILKTQMADLWLCLVIQPQIPILVIFPLKSLILSRGQIGDLTPHYSGVSA